MIGLITCFFNPTNSERLRSNYQEFRKQLKHPITTVELAFEDQVFFIEDSIKLKGNRNNIMFQKERLLNIALESLPEHIDKVAWLDADIIFENPNWIEEAENALDEMPVIQLFEDAYELTTAKFPVNQGIGVGKFITENPDFKIWPSPWPKIGIAWAAQRRVLKTGFFDRHILGSGDFLQFLAWMNWWNHPRINCMPPALRKEFLIWGWEPSQMVNQKIGYISGKIRHLPHGSTLGRAYEKRERTLVSCQFNPTTDLAIDKNGAYKITKSNPGLHTEIIRYFSGRNEDVIL